MRYPRLYVDTKLTTGAHIKLPEQAAHYINRVLRMQKGQHLCVFDGSGTDFDAVIEDQQKHALCVHIGQSTAINNEPPFKLTLVQCLAKGEKMDWIVQKATELGVNHIIPITSTRTDVKLGGQRAQKRLEHWQAIANAACEQSGRSQVPLLDMPQSLTTWLNQPPNQQTLRLLLVPDSEGIRLKHLPTDQSAYEIVIGPEGGLTKDEIMRIKQAGFTAVNIGSRILRTETAGLAVLASINSLFGDM